MSITIRPLCSKDEDAWRDLWHGYVNYYRAEVSEDVTQTTWERILQPDFPIHGLGCINGEGVLIGFVHYLFHPVTWAKAPRCYLEDLFTAKQARGQGAARALINAVNEEARKEGSDQVYWLTENYNERAQFLYDKLATKTPFIKYQQSL